MKKVTSIVLAITLLFSTMFCVAVNAFAETKAPATSITALTAKTKGFTVKWKKKNVSGYQIQYSTGSSFDNSKKVTVKGSGTTTKTVKSLKGKKKYYVRIRTYITKGDKKIYSSWSEKKSVTTKNASNSSSSNNSSDNVSYNGTCVYVTPTGKKYHYSKECAGVNAIEKSLDEAQARYEPCGTCVLQ